MTQFNTISAEAIAYALDKPKRVKDGHYTACCPAHDDRNPSLSITDSGDRVLLHCFSGCPQDAVMDTLRGMGLWGKTDNPITAMPCRAVRPPQKIADSEARKRREQEAAELDASVRKVLGKLKPLTHENHYARRKRLTCDGLYMKDCDVMAVPLYGTSGRYRGIEFIQDKGDGNKAIRSMVGTKKNGSYFMYHGHSNRVLITEGISDASAVFQATGITTMSASGVGGIKYLIPFVKMAHSVVMGQRCPAFEKHIDAHRKLSALVVLPPVPHKDFSDWQLAEGIDALTAKLGVLHARP